MSAGLSLSHPTGDPVGASHTNESTARARNRAAANARRGVPAEWLETENDRLEWVRSHSSALGNAYPERVGREVCTHMRDKGACPKGSLCWFRHDVVCIKKGRRARAQARALACCRLA